MIPYRDQIATAAAIHRLSPDLLAAQVLVESSGHADAFRWEPDFYRRYIKLNPRAKAARYGPLAACSFGLLQILLEVACEIGFTGQPWDLFVPDVNLEWGGRYLASLLEWAHGDYRQALAAFNGGKRGNETPPYRNDGYAAKVFAMKEQLALNA